MVPFPFRLEVLPPISRRFERLTSVLFCDSFLRGALCRRPLRRPRRTRPRGAPRSRPTEGRTTLNVGMPPGLEVRCPFGQGYREWYRSHFSALGLPTPRKLRSTGPHRSDPSSVTPAKVSWSPRGLPTSSVGHSRRASRT